jgi:hypothetical protein
MGKPDAKLDIPSPEWAKHLRPKGKKKFYREQRRKTRLLLKKKGSDD